LLPTTSPPPLSLIGTGNVIYDSERLVYDHAPSEAVTVTDGALILEP
jgi:hypothetical protein